MKTKSTILVVDDDPFCRTLVKDVLEDSGDFSVIEAGSVTEGLSAAVNSRPQLIVLDLVMPDRPGQEFLVEARSNAAIRHIPILICSGRDSDLDARRCGILGAVGFIHKPFEMEELRAAVLKALSR